MDREYTFRFFFGSSGKNLSMGERTAFFEVFPLLVRVARRCADTILESAWNPDGYMATGQSKIVDNAIVGFMKMADN